MSTRCWPDHQPIITWRFSGHLPKLIGQVRVLTNENLLSLASGLLTKHCFLALDGLQYCAFILGASSCCTTTMFFTRWAGCLKTSPSIIKGWRYTARYSSCLAYLFSFSRWEFQFGSSYVGGCGDVKHIWFQSRFHFCPSHNAYLSLVW